MANRTTVSIRFNRLPDLKRRLPQAVQEITLETAEDIQGIVEDGMAEGKSGRMYGSHQASAPGEMPAIDTRELVDSLTVEPDEGGSVVYTEKEKAVPLEYGAPMNNLAPRPFFGPAAQQAEPAFVRKMGDLERRLR